jgi:hypothetical protein
MAIRYFMAVLAGAAAGGVVGSLAGSLTTWIVVGMAAGAGFMGAWHFFETRRDL